LSNSGLLGLKITTLSSILTSKVDQIVKRIGIISSEWLSLSNQYSILTIMLVILLSN
jgi:hypothetical protein